MADLENKTFVSAKKTEKKENNVITMMGRPDYLPDYAMGFGPGIIRLRDAPSYLGMNRNCFRDNVRKYLRAIPIGDNGVGFHRVELDLYIAYLKATIGIPPKETPPWETEAELIEIKRKVPCQINKKPNSDDFDNAAREVCRSSNRFKRMK